MGAFLWDLGILAVICAVILAVIPAFIRRPILAALMGVLGMGAAAGGHVVRQQVAQRKAGKQVREAASTSGMHTVHADAPAATYRYHQPSEASEGGTRSGGKWRIFGREQNGAHATCVAGPGSGKGETLVKPQAYRILAHEDAHLVVNDPKGEVYEEMDAMGLFTGAFVFDFNPGQPTSSMNPVGDPQSARAFAAALLDAPEAKDPYWSSAAKALFTAICAATDYRMSLVELWDRYITDARAMEALGERDPRVRRAYNDVPEEPRGSVLANLRTALDPLDDPQPRRVFEAAGERPMFDPEPGAVREVVFLHPPASGAAEAYAQLVGAVLDQLYRWSSEAYAAGKRMQSGNDDGLRATFWLVDEAASTLALPGLPTYLNLGRGQGQRFCVVLQDVSQLERRLGENGARTVLGSAEIGIWGRVTDYASAEVLSEITGTVRVRHYDVSDTGPGLGRTWRQMSGNYEQGRDWDYRHEDRAAVQPEHMVRQKQFTWFLFNGQVPLDEVEAEPFFAYKHEIPHGGELSMMRGMAEAPEGPPPEPESAARVCEECQQTNPPSALFCSWCGHPQAGPEPDNKHRKEAKTCRNCGTENDATASTCAVCADDL